MKRKVLTSVIGSSIALLMFTSPTLANEIEKQESQLSNVMSKTVSYENVLSDINTEKLNVLPVINEEELNNPISSFGMVPVKLEEVLNLESVTGVNPIHFQNADLSKIVQEWKVVNEQFLRKDMDSKSEIVRVLKENQIVEVLQKENEQWYKVKIVDTVKAELKGKTKTEKKETVGYISSEYIHLLEDKEKVLMDEKLAQELKVIQSRLLTSIEDEIKKEEAEKEKLRLEQERLEKERLEKERLEAQRLEEKRIAAEKERQNTYSRQSSPSSVQTVKTTQKVSVKSAPVSRGSSNVVSNASKYVGAGYLFGASTDRTDVFDCSSFTKRVFSEAGISLPRNSGGQAGVGTTVSKGNLQAGDLVFFNTSGSGISHVGIYVGGGKFVGAQSSGVGYADMNSSYWGPKYITAKRVQ
jgi:cell wall-associated NlpC family hydrolase